MFSVLAKKEFSLTQKIRWLRLFMRAGYDQRFNAIIAMIYDLIPSHSPIIVDVGANVGNFTRGCTQQLKKAHLVLAIEPSHYVFPILEFWSKIWSSKSSKIICRKNILSDNSGVSKLHTPIKVSGSLRVGLAYTGKQKHKEVHIETVQNMRLDDVLIAEGISHVDLVKIDVEGAEENVIKGAPMLLNEIRPIWYLELDDSRTAHMGNSSQRVFNCMIDAGYRAYLIDANINPINVLSMQGNDNYLFVPN
jgi:FkbM family methyltransferase